MLTEDIGLAVTAPAQVNQEQHPPRRGLWALAGALAGSYVLVQMLVFGAFLGWMVVTNQAWSREGLLDSPMTILAILVAGGIAALVTILVAVTWPSVWRAAIAADGPSLAGWLSWRKVEVIPLWVIPFLTLGVLIAGALVVLRIMDPSEVNLQAMLFSTAEARILGFVVVSTLIPVAEELIFRGAIFNALLSRKENLPAWRRNLAPVVVTGLVFAGIHYFAGVNTLAGMVQITLMSFCLSGLRAVTGSVKSSIVAHATWNAVGALALSAAALQT